MAARRARKVDTLPQAIMDEVPAKVATLFEWAKRINDEHVHGFSRDRTIRGDFEGARKMRESADKSVVSVMRANPEPNVFGREPHRLGTVVQRDAR